MVYFSIMATFSATITSAGLGPEDILLIETLAANAWPPERSVILDGWRLRSAGGITRRANSVWPNADTGTASLEDKLAAVEQQKLDRYQRRYEEYIKTAKAIAAFAE